MPARLPTPSDFPSTLTVSIAPPPPRHANVNILILLHGLGGELAPFAQLGRQLNLPHTATLAVQGHTPLPFGLGGYHYGDDIVFDEGSAGPDPHAGFQRVGRELADLVKEVLVGKCGYRSRDVLFYGFGQGGMAALAAAAVLGHEFELGGIVTIGGPLPADARVAEDKKVKTPVLALGGSTGSLLTTAAVQNLKFGFENVSIHRWRRAGDAMPGSREEMLPIMQFLARRLRAAAPAGTVEIG